MTEPNILLVNDDGIDSPGLLALIPVLREVGTLTVVAPSSQKSWIGKASSYHRKLPVNTLEIKGFSAFVLDGTPADCTNAGIFHLCPRKPDLVVSGINVGANIGDAYILSSGTVGGAAEGVIAGIPSIAVGVEFDHETTRTIEFSPREEHEDLFSFAAELTGDVAGVVLSLDNFPEGVLINLNMNQDAGADTEITLTAPARYSYGPFLARKEGVFVHRGVAKNLSSVPPGTDMYAIKSGGISLSFLTLLSDAALSGETGTGAEVLKRLKR